MSDRVHRDRSLPPGYQFGDARTARPFTTAEYDRRYIESAVERNRERLRSARVNDGCGSWRRPSDTDAEQLARRAQAVPAEDAPRLFLSTLHDPARWNVIEGEEFPSDAERHPAELGAPREFHGVRILGA